MDNQEWRTDKFRQAVVAKLAEGLRELQAVAPNYNNPAKHSPEGFEQQAFARSKSREEYLQMLGKIVSAFKRKAQLHRQQAGNQQPSEPHQIPHQQHPQQGQHFPQNQPGQQAGQQGGMMVGARQMGPGGMQPAQGLHQPGQPPQQAGQWGAATQPTWEGQRPQGPQASQMQPMTPEARMQLQQQHQQRMAMAMARAPMGVGPGQQPGQPRLPGQMAGPRQQAAYQQAMQQQAQMNHQSHPGQQAGPVQTGQPQIQPPHAIPANINQPQVPSPSGGFVPSPGHMQQPSPMGGGGGNGPRSVPGIAQSPIATPASAGGGDEDSAYVQKIQQLQKYIEPLRQMIAGMNASDKQNLNKMNKLYEILTSPQRRIPMATLLRSEEVLEGMFEKMGATGGDSVVDTSTVGHSGAGGMNPLLESVFRLRSSEQKSQAGPGLSHALNRSMRAPLEAIFGNDITLPPLPKKMRMATDALTAQSNHDDTTPDIPDVLQGEVARLQPQFKVSLDPAQPSTGPSGLTGMPRRRILLVCQLEDKDLPSVPPLSVSIPPNYPEGASPVCAGFSDVDDDEEDDACGAAVEYTFTPFLTRVREALTSRLKKMPTRFSLSQLLSAWEMSVRAASNVRQTQNQSAVAPRPVPAMV